MPTVPVALSGGRNYIIHIDSPVPLGERLAEVARSRRLVIITQPKIAQGLGAALANTLHREGYGPIPILTFPSGERYKTLRTVERLCDGLYALEPAIDRKTLVIALGGGVVGDVAGFVASLYLRGLDYVQVPTTLLAMVDSSVGGKTGVDFRAGKNLIGAFHQPRAVWIDTRALSTLPPREFRAGLAEVIKYGVIADPALAEMLSREAEGILERDSALIGEIVRRSCEIKAEVVTRDEFETTGLRAILNYGHTIGHALEAVTQYRRYKHGEAVAIGMMAAARIGEVYGRTPPEIGDRLQALLDRYRLPTTLPEDILPETLVPLLGRDKKAEAGRARFVLARDWGNVELVSDVDEATILAGLRRITGKGHRK
ncbi:MAG: 3-dehydroquinate synthase [Capsulimonadales bacterium]|nr:3-dehydroquinate synthase [Capsulimonadales bacterium]